jgi:hypothetical protein
MIKLNYERKGNAQTLTDWVMIIRFFFWLVLASGFCFAQQVTLPTGHLFNNQFGWRLFLSGEIDLPDSVLGGQIDSAVQLNLPIVNRTSSIKSDLLRSSIGSAIGGIVGVGIGGFIPVFLRGEYNSRDFPNDSFYLRSYVSASVLAALFSAAALQMSNQREISYWKFASYSLLPPMVVVMPLSVYASVNSEREELVKSVWEASLVSIGISTLWCVLVYRIHPLRENELTLSFGKPYFSSPGYSQNGFDKSLAAGVKIIEVRF